VVDLRVDRSLVKERLMTRILGALAAVALVFASAGLYGVLGYAVTRRTNEIGIAGRSARRAADGKCSGRTERHIRRDAHLQCSKSRRDECEDSISISPHDTSFSRLTAGAGHLTVDEMGRASHQHAGVVL
jgi:hypothetical protein